jgi:hypothetical protein
MKHPKETPHDPRRADVGFEAALTTLQSDGRTLLLFNGMEASDLASVWEARRLVNTVTVARMRLLCRLSQSQ